MGTLPWDIAWASASPSQLPSAEPSGQGHPCAHRKPHTEFPTPSPHHPALLLHPSAPRAPQAPQARLPQVSVPVPFPASCRERKSRAGLTFARICSYLHPHLAAAQPAPQRTPCASASPRHHGPQRGAAQGAVSPQSKRVPGGKHCSPHLQTPLRSSSYNQ